MPLLYYVQNTAIGIIIILIMLYYILGQGGKRQPQDSLFVYLLFSVLVLLILELFMDICNGRTFRGAYVANVTTSFLFYFLLPWPGFFYFLYIDQLQHKWEQMPAKLGLLIAIPMHLSGILGIISLFNGMIFTIDASNFYHRGEYLFVVVLCNAFYLVAGQIHAFHLYLKHRQRVIPFIILFPYPVVIAAILQLLTVHMSAMLVTLSITLLIVYLRIQNTQANKDFLTLLYNRSIGEEYLKHLFIFKGKKKLVGGMLMDIDGFKRVNDEYGHDFGDTCLRSFSQLLNDSFSRNWLICRYGGDEFLLVRQMDAPSEMDEDIKTFKKNWNLSTTKKPFHFP